MNSGQPRPEGRIAQLVAEQVADGSPEVVSRLGGKVFFHRGIHRCGQRGCDAELVQVVHEVAQQRTGRDFGEVHLPSEEAEASR